MAKRILIISFISVLVLLYLFTELNKDTPYIYDLNFSGLSKDPYGCFVLRETLEENRNLHFLESINKTLYEGLPSGGGNTRTIIIITDNFEQDSINLTSLYQFVSKGNKAFISAYSFGKDFRDSLKFETKYFDLFAFRSNTDTLDLVNPSLKLGSEIFNNMARSGFSSLDSANHVVLGTNNSGKANYIRVNYGFGFFYIHCQPLAFTNYHILYSSSQYPLNALSYFKDDDLIWDDYNKPPAGKYFSESRTPFRYLLSQEAFRIALYLTLVLTGIYILIESKRKQRFIPIVQPPENSTVNFISTIARLHQGQMDYKKMAQRKYHFFKDLVYSRYFVRLDDYNPQTFEIFAEKAGLEQEKVKKIIDKYIRIESSVSISANDLIEFSKMIDKIYQHEKEK